MASKTLWLTGITNNDSTAKEQLGILRKEWNATDSCFKTYKYVQATSATTVANGTPLAFYNTIGQQVTTDISTASSNQPAGVGIGAITASQYGWIQVGGYHSAVITNGDDDISDGDSVNLDRVTDGVADSIAAGTANTVKLLGVAVADDVDASDTVAVLLDCTYGGVV